ncbi:MAG: class I SAM-dependent rRNA methyltransferase, partial [Clostridia bacterium]|nr:class I SAM-dependent rRNA methyltransferase [Clostridia bacterium]
GLTVDRFEDILVIQTLSLGIERRKDLLFPLLVDILRESGAEISAIYERNDVNIRTLEGMEEGCGFYLCDGLDPAPAMTEAEICENGITYSVDFMHGQKTGFFLDQKYNRLAAAKLAAGRTVLDCFTHTGSFALNAAKAGAKHVDAVDISADAIAMTRRNAERNGLSGRMGFITADVFALLDELNARKERKYDMIILDPPAFTKSAGTVNSAYGGYREINKKALQLLPRGGYFATASCSHFMPSELFCKMLREAAYDAKVTLRQIEARQQAPDHPILWTVPETDYLKFYLFQVV